jgi:hypothetical protein
VNFLNPLVPEKSVNCVLLDGREIEIGNALERLGIEVIYTEKCDELYEAISYHPDILVHPVEEKEVIVAPNVSQRFINELTKFGIKVIKGKTFLKRNYPYDIAYNVARLGNTAFHNLKYTDPVLREILEEKGVKFQTVDKISGTRYYEKGSLFFMKQKRRGEGRCYQRNRMQDIK